MIVYSVSIKLDNNIAQEWLKYMKEIHIADVMKTGCFVSYQIKKETTSPTPNSIGYNIEYSCSNLAELDRYQENFAKKLQADHTKRYQGKFEASRKIYEIIT